VSTYYVDPAAGENTNDGLSPETAFQDIQKRHPSGPRRVQLRAARWRPDLHLPQHIDQRIPTRGYRTLPPDAPAPHIWRYGTSYKTGNPMPEVYVYQNTFIGSHRDDKGSALTVLFANGHLSPDAPRIHLNNLIVEPHRDEVPLFRFQHPNGSLEPVETLAELHQLDPAWELGSRLAEPILRNVDDEIFDQGLYHGEAYPNNDFRPASASPAIGAGVVLSPSSSIPIAPRTVLRQTSGPAGCQPAASRGRGRGDDVPDAGDANRAPGRVSFSLTPTPTALRRSRSTPPAASIPAVQLLDTGGPRAA
jgi:hypothetical protein